MQANLKSEIQETRGGKTGNRGNAKQGNEKLMRVIFPSVCFLISSGEVPQSKVQKRKERKRRAEAGYLEMGRL